MKQNVILTELGREIWKTRSRFFSIVAIIALGTGFFSGLKATTPDMKATADAYYQDSRLSDFHLVSTMGITKEDIAEIHAIDGIDAVMPGYSADVFLRQNNESNLIAKLISLPINQLENEANYLNQPKLVSGRMPYQSGECLLDAAAKRLVSEDILHFASGDSEAELADSLSIDSCKVVGYVNSARFVNFERGSSRIGNGTTQVFVLLPEQDFAYEFFTDLYLAVDSSGVSAFSEEYETLIDNYQLILEEFGDRRKLIRYDDIYQEAMEKINDAKEELLDGKTKADRELKDAWRKILDGEEEWLDGKQTLADEQAKAEQEIADAKRELADGELEYAKQYADFEKEIAAAQKKIDDGWIELAKGEAKLENGRRELADGQGEYNQQKVLAEKQLEEAQAGLNAFKPLSQNVSSITIANYQTNPIYHGLLQVASQFPGLETVLTSFENTPNDTTLGYLIQTVQTIETTMEKQISDGEAQLADGAAQLRDAASKLNAGQRELNQARIDLEEGQKKLLEEKALALHEFQVARAKLDDGAKELADAEVTLAKELADAKQELDDGERDLRKAKQDYAKGKREANEEIEDGEVKISDAEKELAKLEYPKWYVFDRTQQPGYANYGEDADRVDKISAVFPVFFILVAALVCLTTMSRMVEEQRTQIGTMKALGYGTKTIIGKYMSYALLASILGAAIGLSVGFVLFPKIIFAAYLIMYQLPPVMTPYHWPMALGSVLVSILCTTGAAFLACRKELTAQPSQLMRPKAPKNGKRVLFERLPFLWNRLSFSMKVTIRNLFRYKARVLMTILGTGGCTALILAGFGMQYSISSIVDKQYQTIFHHDVMIALEENTTSAQLKTLHETLNNTDYLDDFMYIYSKKIDASSLAPTRSAFLFVAEDTKHLETFVDFHTRIEKTPLTLSDDGVIINEKLAKLLKIKVGDSITLHENNQLQEVPVTGIMENYTMNYIYMSSAFYKQTFQKQAEANMVLAAMQEDNTKQESALATMLLEQDAVLGISYTRETGKTFADMIGSLNIIVGVIILFAGALAFIVLYNLTNINVNERIRELATIKVLGFYDGEVSSYIYRENTISAMLGMVTGLGIGIILHRFIIQTAEVEMVMFNPAISRSGFLYACVLTMFFTLIVNIALHFRLKRIDMVESLKSVE